MKIILETLIISLRTFSSALKPLRSKLAFKFQLETEYSVSFKLAFVAAAVEEVVVVAATAALAVEVDKFISEEVEEDFVQFSSLNS